MNVKIFLDGDMNNPPVGYVEFAPVAKKFQLTNMALTPAYKVEEDGTRTLLAYNLVPVARAPYMKRKIV